MKTSSVYFVLKGLVNGEADMCAVESHSTPDQTVVQADGWYYCAEGNPDGVGPYDSREAAVAAENAAPAYYGRIDGEWERMRECDTDEYETMVSVRLVKVVNDGMGGEVDAWRIQLEGSYETLTLEISGPSRDLALSAYAALLEASSFQ